MCSISNVNKALEGVVSSSLSNNNTVSIPSITAHRVKQNRNAYFVVDIREASEIEANPMSEAADIGVPLGAICHDANASLLSKVNDNNKTLVLVCATGARATLAAQSILAQQPPPPPPSQKIAVLQRGLIGWTQGNAAVVPDFVVVLGLDDSEEKLSLSLAAAAAASDVHSTVVLVLMSNGVNWFVNPMSPKAEANNNTITTPNVETIHVGEPFKPCKAMLTKFLSNSGIILACTTCVKHRHLSFDTDMMNCVDPMQMPDLIRMLGEAKGGNLQFL